MSKFKFSNTDCEGVTTTVEFESETWIDTFPHYLNLLRGAGFSVSDKTGLYVEDSVSPAIFSDRDFLVFSEETIHAKCYFDTQRNK